jgi:hypothetical protein
MPSDDTDNTKIVEDSSEISSLKSMMSAPDKRGCAWVLTANNNYYIDVQTGEIYGRIYRTSEYGIFDAHFAKNGERGVKQFIYRNSACLWIERCVDAVTPKLDAKGE